MSVQKTLADALESEVLTEMAGTFFGARKRLEDMVEDFHLHVEELKAEEAKVFSRLFFLRSLLLDQEGEARFFAAIGVAPPFGASRTLPGSRTWSPDRLPFALFPSTRYVKAVLLAYAELRRSCTVYMTGEFVPDPERSGRKRLTVNYELISRLCARLNERIDKQNTEMTPSSVLQYARDIHMADQPGHGTLSNSLGAESLDKSLMFPPVEFAALNLWKAPDLPAPESCEAAIRAFCAEFYASRAAQIKRVLAGLD